MSSNHKPLNFTHRGFKASYPENTLAAFEAGRIAGGDGVELDVHCTRDGHLVVIHDETFDRTTDGKGFVKDTDLAQIRRLDAGSWFGDEFVGQRIPLLDEVLEWASRHKQFVNIELKTDTFDYPGIERKVIDAVNRFDMRENVIISSFNFRSLQTVKRINADFEIGLLYEEAIAEPWLHALQMNAQAIHPHILQVNADIVAACKEHGIRIHPWTVNEESDLQCMIDLGVDMIITNHPDRLSSILRTY